MVPATDTLSVIMETTCVLTSLEKMVDRNIFLQNFTLFTKTNGKIRNVANGETIAIDHPWMKTDKCLPDIIELELWLVWRRLEVTKLVHETFPTSMKNYTVPINDAHQSLRDVLGIKFRFNYLIF